MADGLAVAEAAVTGHSLERVSRCMAEIQNSSRKLTGAVNFFPLIARDD